AKRIGVPAWIDLPSPAVGGVVFIRPQTIASIPDLMELAGRRVRARKPSDRLFAELVNADDPAALIVDDLVARALGRVAGAVGHADQPAVVVVLEAQLALVAAHADQRQDLGEAVAGEDHR